MAFMCSMACAFSLLSLSAGVGLLIFGFRNEGVGVVLAKVFGFIITILSSLIFLSSSYMCLNHIAKGHDHHRMGMYKMHNKDNCACKKNHEFCNRNMPNKVERQVN